MIKNFFHTLPDQSDAELPPGVELRRSSRARRLSLRLDAPRGRVVLTVPRRASLRLAQTFAWDHRTWIENKMATLPPPRSLAPGMRIPFLDAELEIIHSSTRVRAATVIENGCIRVHGKPEHIARRVRDALKKEAQLFLTARAQAKALLLEKTLKSVTVRDTKSRWGSCTAGGHIALSWRLVLAPEYVADYVVAHEVAHLAHMNHSKKFWQLCDSLCERGPEARTWLKKNGAALHRFGA